MPAFLTDFYSPFFSVAIVTKGGKRYPFWSDLDPQLAAAAGIDPMLCFLQSATVEINLGSIAKITAELKPPPDQALRIINSPLVQYGFNQLELQFG